MKQLSSLLLTAAFALPASAIEYRTVNLATILYDAPSLKGSKLFVIKRGTPVELVVNLEGWSKVRDPEGGLAWIEASTLVKRRSVMVTAARAQVRESADEAAAVVFEAEKNVSLEYLEAAPSGWIKVRHREGSVGFVRVNQIWGI